MEWAAKLALFEFESIIRLIFNYFHSCNFDFSFMLHFYLSQKLF